MGKVNKIAVGKYSTGRIFKYQNSYVYIPYNLPKNPKASIFYPGYQAFTGPDSDISRYIGQAIASQGGNQIVIVEQYNREGTISTSDSVLTTLNNTNTNIIRAIEKVYKINISSVSTMGSSMGDRYALKNYVSLVKSGRDSGCCVLMGISDTGKAGRAILTNEEYKILKGKTVFCFEPTDATGYKYINTMAKKGVNVILVACRNGEHNALTAKPVCSNLFKLIDGNPQNFLNDNNYTFVRYDSKRNKWVTMSNSDVKKVSENLAKKSVGINEQENRKNKLTDIYGYSLPSLNSLGTALHSLYSARVVCNNEYIRDSLQNICSAVNPSPFLSQQAVSDYASTTKVPDAYSTEYKTIMATVLQIYQLLHQDIQNVTICGDSIKAMDDSFQKKASDINDGGDNYYGNDYSYADTPVDNNDDGDTDTTVIPVETVPEVAVSEPVNVVPSNLVSQSTDNKPEIDNVVNETEELLDEFENDSNKDNYVEPVADAVPPVVEKPIEEEILNVQPAEEIVEDGDNKYNSLLAFLCLGALAGAAVAGTAYGVKKYKEAKEEEKEYSSEEEDLEVDDI